MPKRVLDTNILMAHFHKLRPLDGKSPAASAEWAGRLMQDKESDAIVSPVVVEFLCGVLNQDERMLREGFLKAFRVIDGYRTLPEDWAEALRIAKHPGFHATPRDLGDCLITAISSRLRHEVLTDDKGLIQQRGRTRQRRA
jgi:predicted nucleic acid-binding protein